MTDVAQQVQELQAQLDALRVLLGVVVALLVLLVVGALAIWSQQRRVVALLRAREPDIEAAGAHAREELARRRIRTVDRKLRRCGTGAPVPPAPPTM